MITEAIRELYAYTTWGNQRIMEGARKLTEEQFLENVGPSYGSMRYTLVHTMSAQWIWLERWNGISPPAMMEKTDFPDLSSIEGRWETIERDTRRFLDDLGDDNLDRIVSYTTTEGTPAAFPLWQVMLHQANHATQHRSEAAVMLTNFGYSPGDLDLVVYLSETGS